jgi:uncharacterized membrane protein YphA (DoxX/SURF4 family)
MLRVAIGWHFHTEGWEKVDSVRKGKPFSAEGYLRASTGPLSPYFRGIIPDVNSLARLDPDRLKAAWREDVTRIADHYGFNQDQRTKADAELKDCEHFADVWFHDRENNEKRFKYYNDLRTVQKVEQNPGALSFERERAAEKRKELENDRKDLTKELDARGSALREAVIKLATPDQLASAGGYKPAWTTLDRINTLTTYGIWLIGLCLILGLFTRPAALGAAVFLAQIYLSMPPWPGLPLGPKAEGHYWIVDKNLVEMLACLSLACLPTGQWVGLDALLFGRYARARAARRAERHEQRAERRRTAHTVS